MEKLIDLFKLYLNTQGISLSSSKNYLVDLRNFLEWFLLRLKTENVPVEEDIPASLASFITKERVGLYKTFLLNNETPFKTINRRLSTLRKFGSFLVKQGWTSSNPAATITNAGTQINMSNNNKKYQDNLTREILGEFRKDLEKQKATPLTIKNYLADTAQFLKYLNQI